MENGTEQITGPEQESTPGGEEKFSDQEKGRIEDLVNEIYASGEASKADDEKGTGPRAELQKMGCDISYIDQLGVTKDEYLDFLLRQPKPKVVESQLTTEDGKSVERNVNETLKVPITLKEKNTVEITTEKTKIRIVFDASSPTKLKVENYGENNVLTRTEDLKEGVNIVRKFGENDIVINVPKATQRSVTLEASQEGFALKTANTKGEV